MSDARSKAVLGKLADLAGRNNYGIDLGTTSLREPLGNGDIIDVPSISDLTVIAAGTTSTAPAAVTTNVLSMNANLEPWINASIPQLASMQLLDGGWEGQVAEQAFKQLKNYVDEQWMLYLLQSVIADTASSPAYWYNAGGASLGSDDFANAKAALLSQDGVQAQDLVCFLSPFAEASASQISGFVPNFQQAEQGNLGIPKIGSIHGVPVYVTNSVSRLRTVATTAYAVSGGVQTATVAAGHGVVVGAKLKFDTVTSGGDEAAAVTVSAVGATSIAWSTSNTGSATEAGTITLQQCENLMVNKAQNFSAGQGMMKARTVADLQSTGDSLQVSTVWARVSRAGHAIAFGSPPSGA